MPLGKYCLESPFAFSLDPRRHGLCGSRIDLDVGGERETLAVGHLFAAISGQRLVELVR